MSWSFPKAAQLWFLIVKIFECIRCIRLPWGHFHRLFPLKGCYCLTIGLHVWIQPDNLTACIDIGTKSCQVLISRMKSFIGTFPDTLSTVIPHSWMKVHDLFESNFTNLWLTMHDYEWNCPYTWYTYTAGSLDLLQWTILTWEKIFFIICGPFLFFMT